VNIAVYFIRAKSNLILSYSSEGFPIYIRCSERRGDRRETGYRGKGERGGEDVY